MFLVQNAPRQYVPAAAPEHQAIGFNLLKSIKSVGKNVAKAAKAVAKNPVVQLANPAMALSAHGIAKGATGKGIIAGRVGKAVDLGTAGVLKKVGVPAGIAKAATGGKGLVSVAKAATKSAVPKSLGASLPSNMRAALKPALRAIPKPVKKVASAPKLPKAASKALRLVTAAKAPAKATAKKPPLKLAPKAPSHTVKTTPKTAGFTKLSIAKSMAAGGVGTVAALTGSKHVVSAPVGVPTGTPHAVPVVASVAPEVGFLVISQGKRRGDVLFNHNWAAAKAGK